MATSGRPLPSEVRVEVIRLLQLRLSQRKVARECRVSLTTVRKLKKQHQQQHIDV